MNLDTFPNTIDYWGPSGMSFIRNPQVRYTAPLGEGTRFAVSLEAPNAAIDTGKVSPIASNLGLQGRTQFPDVIGKYAMDRKWGHVPELAGMVRSVGYESTATPDNNPSGAKTGWGFNLNGWYNVGEQGPRHRQPDLWRGHRQLHERRRRRPRAERQPSRPRR